MKEQTNPLNPEFPTLEKIDFITGLRVLDYIERNGDMGWTDFGKGKNLSFIGFFSATRRLGKNTKRYNAGSYHELADHIDSSTDSESHAYFKTDERVASLRNVIGQRYAGRKNIAEVTKGAFAIYRVARVAFREEEFSNEDIEGLLADIPNDVLLARIRRMSLEWQLKENPLSTSLKTEER